MLDFFSRVHSKILWQYSKNKFWGKDQPGSFRVFADDKRD